jgi:multidrug efflux pump subunit AcrB
MRGTRGSCAAIARLQDLTRGFARFVPTPHPPENNANPVETPATGFDAKRTIAANRIYLDKLNNMITHALTDFLSVALGAHVALNLLPMNAGRHGNHSPPLRGGLAQFFVEHRELGWLAMVATLLCGWFAYHSLPQQEDPTFPRHDALVVTVFPGASAQQVEQLVTHKLEARLAEQDVVEELRSQSRANVSVIHVMLRQGREAKVAQEWDKLRARLHEIALPESCEPPRLDTEYQATATLLLSVASQQHSYRELERAAGQLESELKRIASVGRVRLFGNVPEQVELRFSTTNLARYRLAPEQVIQSLAARNAINPGGTFPGPGRDLPVQISGAFQDEEEIGAVMLGLGPDRKAVRVREVFEVRRGYTEPPAFNVDTLHRTGDGAMAKERSVLLAVEMKSGSIIGKFDQAVGNAVRTLSLPAGMKVLTVSDQPTATSHRIQQFNQCFIEAVVIVVIVCLLLMEWRSALVVALAIPLTLAMTLGGMALLHIPLQQISIAALIIALGLLVDDPVVAADGINRELAAGRPAGVAAWLGPYRLRRAILFGTIINIVAFLPLVLLPGDMGAFIVALPLVITLALVSSRIVSMTFVPLLGWHLLRGQRGFEAGGEVRSCWMFKPVDRLFQVLLPGYQSALQQALKHPAWTVGIAYGLLGASFALTGYFGQQFFPPAERHQCVIDVQLPPSSSITQTRAVCDRIAELLRSQEAIVNAAVFCGGTAPNFYYNVLPREPAANLAQVLINTQHADDVPALVVKLRAALDREITNATCVVRQLDQGPALEAPIMIRLTGDDLDVLREQADAVGKALRAADGYKVSDDLGQPVPTLRVVVDQERANRAGITSLHVGRVLQSAFVGFRATRSRENGHLIPVLLRMQPDDCDSLKKLEALPVSGSLGETLPLGEIAELTEALDYPVVSRSGAQRAVTVKAHAVFGELPSRVLRRARETIDQMPLPAGYNLEYAGEARELTSSRREMQRVMAISLALIALTMVIQFRSGIKSLVVMLTVPLGLTGAFVGLAVMQASFGFMALLGIVSLAGVTVSHIIVLSDFIEEARANGMELKQALMQAALVRLRAVLVTVLATVCGLMPLALQGGELWRPLTAVHIFGLLLATLLTLLVLPIWYYLFAARLRWIK